jgi:hypothetical protein
MLSKHQVEFLARAKFGQSANVFTHFVRSREGSGHWYCLSIDGELVGRRRELEELLEMIENRTCSESPHPAGTILGAS